MIVIHVEQMNTFDIVFEIDVAYSAIIRISDIVRIHLCNMSYFI